MYKKLLNTFIFTISIFMLGIVIVNASECKLMPTADNGSYSTVDEFNERSDSERVIPSDQKLSCKYNNYEDTETQSSHIESYYNGNDDEKYVYVYEITESKNGGTKKTRMLACYTPSADQGIPRVFYDTFDIYVSGESLLGAQGSHATGFAADFSSSCAAYAGMAYYPSDDAPSFYYNTGAEAIVDENVKVGSIAETGEGFTRRVGFNPAEVKNLYELYGKTKQKRTYEKNSEKYEKNLCNMPATLKTLRILSYIIMIARYVAVLLLIIFLTIDIGKVAINDGDFKKIQKSVMVRIGVAVAIFFIPVIVNAFVHMVSKNEDSAFHNCSVCFFKDKFNSYNECEKKIEELGEKVENSFIGNDLDKICTDPDKNGYNDDKAKACGNVPDQRCTDEWVNSHSASDYVIKCKCNNDDYNGYNEKIATGCKSLQNTMPAEYEKCIAGYKSSHQKYIDDCISNN